MVCAIGKNRAMRARQWCQQPARIGC